MGYAVHVGEKDSDVASSCQQLTNFHCGNKVTAMRTACEKSERFPLLR